MNALPTFQDGIANLPIDESIYTRDAVLRTSYWFTDRCYFFISRPVQGALLVTIRLKESRPTLEKPQPEVLEKVIGEYQNALLDQQLRIDIETQTRTVRDLLIAKAFAETGVADNPPPGEFRDPVEIMAPV